MLVVACSSSETVPSTVAPVAKSQATSAPQPTTAPTAVPATPPTDSPTAVPTAIPEPTLAATIAPTVEPTLAATIAPTVEPTPTPTANVVIVDLAIADTTERVRQERITEFLLLKISHDREDYQRIEYFVDKIDKDGYVSDSRSGAWVSDIIAPGTEVYAEIDFEHSTAEYEKFGPFEYQIRDISSERWDGNSWDVIDSADNDTFDLYDRYMTNKTNSEFEYMTRCKIEYDLGLIMKYRYDVDFANRSSTQDTLETGTTWLGSGNFVSAWISIMSGDSPEDLEEQTTIWQEVTAEVDRVKVIDPESIRYPNTPDITSTIREMVYRHSTIDANQRKIVIDNDGGASEPCGSEEVRHLDGSTLIDSEWRIKR